MRPRLAFAAILLILGGCSLFANQPHYSIYFQPYSAALEDQARATLHDTADYANAHPNQPVFITGYAAPPDPGKDVDGLSAQRAEAVSKALTSAGISADRIFTRANGETDPGVMPSVAVRRVDIRFGP
jgi:outer membrane protein OmpA-like peptidoglycan-associated protein